MKSGRDLNAVTIPLVFLGGGVLFAYVVLAAKLGIPFAIPVGIIGSVAAAVALHGPVGKALARLLDGGTPAVSDETTGAMLGELDELRQRVSELEERVDFSERLLAQHPDRGRLAEGSDR